MFPHSIWPETLVLSHRIKLTLWSRAEKAIFQSQLYRSLIKLQSQSEASKDTMKTGGQGDTHLSFAQICSH